jgi:hypothetical protein
MVKEALKMSARDLGPSGPDNTYGWGLPNGLSALNASPATVADYGCIGNESFPASFSLGSPYPNPFNPAVAIPFRLSSPARVTVSVYDITGRLIAILYNGIAMTGEHRVIWNAGRQSSGVYLIRMNWGKRTEVRKALLVK